MPHIGDMLSTPTPTKQPVRTPGDTLEKRRARGLRIRWAREEAEPIRYEFARKLGVDTTTIRNIENGKANPGLQLLHEICHSLRISLDYIVDGKLIGVDPELAGLLVAHHPELVPPPRQSGRTHRHGKSGKDYPTNISPTMSNAYSSR